MWENPEIQHIDEAMSGYLQELHKLLCKIGINPKIQSGILFNGADNCNDDCAETCCDSCDANSDKLVMITSDPMAQKQLEALEKCIEDYYVRGGGVYTRENKGFIEYLKYVPGSVYGNIFAFIRLKYTPSEHRLLKENSNAWGTTIPLPTLASYVVLQYLSDVSLPHMPNMTPRYAEDQLMLLAGKYFLEDLLDDYVSSKYNHFIETINIVSSLAYERQANIGNIVLLHKSFLAKSEDNRCVKSSYKNKSIDSLHPRLVQLCIRFADPISMSNHKRVRKLFEIATGETYLVGDGEYIYGIATKKSLQEQTVDKYVLISIQGPLRWELYEIRSAQFKEKLLRVVYDSIGFKVKRKPTYKLDVRNKLTAINQYITDWLADSQCSPCQKCAYRNVCRSTNIGNFESVDTVVTRLTDIIKDAAGQKHGTTIVFSRCARQEVQRLKKTCFQIEDVRLSLDSGLIKPITAIDGAVICDFDGVCHAIGVILDGMTIVETDTELEKRPVVDKIMEEDISRGARYNSAIRYKNAHPCSIICIVSEDGDVNII